jgi:DNA-binding ferritin-like protein
MYRTRNDLPAKTRATMIALLNGRLADAVDEYADLIAERAVQLGGTARGTAREVAAASGT